MSELTNLLSKDRVRALSHEYFFRLGTVVSVALTLLVAVHGALLVPSYLYLSEEVETRKAHLATLEASLMSSEERAVQDRLTALSEDADRLLSLTHVPAASRVVDSILKTPRDGISITGITVAPPETGEGQMRIIGVAKTREALKRFHGAVSVLPFVSRADLPLSVYAEEADIPFSIAVSGTLAP